MSGSKQQKASMITISTDYKQLALRLLLYSASHRKVGSRDHCWQDLNANAPCKSRVEKQSLIEVENPERLGSKDNLLACPSEKRSALIDILDRVGNG